MKTTELHIHSFPESKVVQRVKRKVDKRFESSEVNIYIHILYDSTGVTQG